MFPLPRLSVNHTITLVNCVQKAEGGVDFGDDFYYLIVNRIYIFVGESICHHTYHPWSEKNGD